jgi:hypothetical protein
MDDLVHSKSKEQTIVFKVFDPKPERDIIDIFFFFTNYYFEKIESPYSVSVLGSFALDSLMK